MAAWPLKGDTKPQAGGEPWRLWYAQPATRWLEALPVGNGRLGAMVFGGIGRERVALNESTVWSGAPSDFHENPSALDHLAERAMCLTQVVPTSSMRDWKTILGT